jgi:hypothetical protein
MTAIIRKFHIRGNIKEIQPLGNGLINDTSRLVNGDPAAPDYVLQRINNKVFQDVDLLQRNIEAVTRHIRRKLEAAGEEDIDRKVLQFVPTDEGKTYYRDGDGNYWRVMVFIKDSVTYETVDEKFSYTAGCAFGDFEAKLADIPDQLGETIPDFHNMELRMRQLREAVAADKAGRLQEVQAIVDEMLGNGDDLCLAEQLHRQGLLPKRVCHCDTKVNNMLFDRQGHVLCVIDLDTVMPSYVFSDYGDFLRTAANTAPEDEPDVAKVSFNLDIFRAFTRGYLESTRTFLTPVERQQLPYAVCLFPFMQAVRFLTDYLNGDTYYKTQYPEHNLVRTRAQMKLWHSATSCKPAMQAYIDSLG